MSVGRAELELLAKDQDSMHDPLGIGSKRAALRQERAQELATYDQELQSISELYRPSIAAYRASVTAALDEVFIIVYWRA